MAADLHPHLEEVEERMQNFCQWVFLSAAFSISTSVIRLPEIFLVTTILYYIEVGLGVSLTSVNCCGWVCTLYFFIRFLRH